MDNAPPRSSRELSVDEALNLLKDFRCRVTVSNLPERRTPVELTDLANEVAASECETPSGEPSAERREAVLRRLYHVEIPKLVEAGVLEYQHDRETVRPTERLTTVRELANSLHDGDE